MTQLWMDGFDHYGAGDSGRTAMLQGPWAEVSPPFLGDNRATPVIPTFGARTGTHALEIDTNGANFARRVLGGSESTIIASFGLYLPQIPDVDTRIVICGFMIAGTDCAGSLYAQSDGSISLRGPAIGLNNWPAAPLLGSTTGPALTAGTWNHIEVSFTQSATVGACEVRVNEQVVLNLTTLDTGATALNQLMFAAAPATVFPAVSVPNNVYYDDIVIRNTAGALNNGFQGDLRVATLQPIANAVAQGWTPRTIEKLGIGVLGVPDDSNRDSGLTFLDDVALEIGASDYAMEGFFRFGTALTTTQRHVLASKFRTDNNERSWKLEVLGPDSGSVMQFSTSTDGTLGDVQIVHSFPFVPDLNRWFHIAVTREGTDSRLFLDGVQIGLTQTDSRTYDDNTARVAISGEMSGSNTITIDTALDGWVDGFRLTIGAARYTANFTPPTAPLPTDVGGDALFNSVELLLNFDNDAVTDQSNNAFTGSLRNSAVQVVPADGSAFQTIDGLAPIDADFIEAALLAATGTLTFAANPLNTETITLGSVTYTFQTVLVDTANNVLIGATASDSLDNLLAAVNLGPGIGTLYGTGTLINPDAGLSTLPGDQLLATASTPGAAGNALATTSTVTGGTWSAATLLGGADIPGESEFDLSALPSEVTGIRAVAIVNRAFKTDSGSSSMQSSFVTSGGASSQGADRAVTLSPTYFEDTFETDPDTAGAITPSTLNGARIRINRTL